VRGNVRGATSARQELLRRRAKANSSTDRGLDLKPDGRSSHGLRRANTASQAAARLNMRRGIDSTGERPHIDG